MKTKPTLPLPVVSIVSPWKTGSPILNSKIFPSILVALTVPLILVTSPIERTSVSAAWAYLPIETGPAKVDKSDPFSKRPLLVKTDGRSKLEK